METGHILIVEDEPVVRRLLRTMLERQGHACSEAADAREALALMRAHGTFDVVISDILLGEMHGLELLDRLQRDCPDVPIVIITGSHDMTTAMAALRRGAFDYLVKPFSRDQLDVVMQRALSHRRMTQMNPTHRYRLEQLIAARTEMLTQTMQELERSYDITLEALGDALDLKDAETEGHSKRVTAYTIALARAIGFAQDEIRTIARGAFLHDIGKMAIPDAILLKPAALTEDERTVMREHCARGYQMVRKIPYLKDAAEIIYSHQERYDGSGYPQGLRGEQIPFGARIFAIADTLDAITSDRPYRKASTFAEARTEIMKYAGTQFDPNLVAVYANLPDKLWQDLRDEIERHIHKFQTFLPIENTGAAAMPPVAERRAHVA